MTTRASFVFGSTLTIALAVAISAHGQTPAGQQPADSKMAQERQAAKSGNPITDGWITMKIHSQFIPEDALSDSDIDVDTNAGVVTLTGTVPTEAGRARAVAIAQATDGVKNVNDTLRIGPEGATTAGRDAAAGAKSAGRKVNDGWITSKIYAQFLGENSLEDSDIDVDVVKGVVTLTGTVRSEAGRGRAVAIAKATDGVTSVKDSLKVVSRPTR
jgi:hyperosmotically inducible protein